MEVHIINNKSYCSKETFMEEFTRYRNTGDTIKERDEILIWCDANNTTIMTLDMNSICVSEHGMNIPLYELTNL